jgi:hypothetical protein
MRTVTHLKFIVFTLIVASQSAPAVAQALPASDPTLGFDRPFGLGGHSCKQYDDTGKLFLYSEGMLSPNVRSWMQRSAGGTKANVPMPQELVAAIPLIPGCLPGKHHAAATSG